MKIVIALDAFKGSMTSIQAGEAVKRGLSRVYPDAETTLFPIADGGEGTVDALTYCGKGNKKYVDIHGPLGKQIKAAYGILEDNTAVIEVAQAVGFSTVNPGETNPMDTSTYGVGELILSALDSGCRDFIIGLGGTITNDIGTGMLSALGCNFYDRNDKLVETCGKNIGDIHRIDFSNMDCRLKESRFFLAADVTNPLFGSNGAAKVYGPQKGATSEMIDVLDRSAIKFSKIVSAAFDGDKSQVPGSGAAGGLGFAFLCFLDAEMKRGTDIIFDSVNLESSIKNADYVITGEGRIDSQTILGKSPIGVAKIAKKYGIPVIAFSGCVGDSAAMCNDYGIDAFFTIMQSNMPQHLVMDAKIAEAGLEMIATQVFSLIRSTRDRTLIN